MPTNTYQERRLELETYFDRTAAEAWKRLTSTEKVSGIRATVRAGRDAMRAHLLSWLPKDMTTQRLLDAGCGTGSLSVEAAARGANVLAIDIAETLVDVARERTVQIPLKGTIDFQAGDMLAVEHGTFDYAVAMDSLIHYEAEDVVAALSQLAPRVEREILFTFTPSNFALKSMHQVGKLFPRSDRSPAIIPTEEKKLRQLMASAPALQDFAVQDMRRIKSGFYISQAVRLVRREARNG